MERKAVLAGAVRTAIGKFGGALSQIPAHELGTVVIRESLRRACIAPEMVDEVIMGCILQAGQGQNPARQAAVNAGIPVEVPAQTLNILCGSGLKAVNLAAMLVASGEADIVMAGGMENMSATPYILSNARYGYRMGDGILTDTLIYDGLTDAFHKYHMGMTAENVAERYGITRAEQDAFAAASQQKCERAQEAGRFADEICSVTVKDKNGESIFDRDEFPRSGVTAEGLAKLKSAFKKDGTVTAANSSGVNDGAAAIIVMSEEKAAILGVTPMATFVAGATAGVDPAVMGIGPVFSTKSMEKSGLTPNDIDLIEANEAFAAQSLAVIKLLGLNPEKVNVNGGAIALGHPVGASGTRILVSLLYEMQRRDLHRGLATLCVGGGMGVSAVVER